MTARCYAALGASLVAMLGFGPTADAYHNADFATPVTRGGGNGIYFNGSPRYKRYDCTACHALASGAIAIELASDPAELIAERRYTPGASYRLIVTMFGEHLGDPRGTSGFDHNSFVAELDDDGGQLVGSWSSDDRDRVFTMDVAGGEAQVVAGYDGRGGTTWSVSVVAPVAGTGRITLYLGAVDGNAAGGGVETVVDPFGDDVFVGAWRFCEAGSSCDTTVPEVSEEDIEEAHASPASGCSTAGHGSGWPLVLAAVVLLAAVRRRLVIAAVAIAVVGCADDPVVVECPNGICEYSSEGNPFGNDPVLNRAFFACEVQPVLQARCANLACHGDERRPLIVYAPARLRLDGDDSGETAMPTTELEFRTNYETAREFARDDQPGTSLLAIKPLDSRAGGFYHFGEALYYQGDVFGSTADVGYQTLLDWIGGATAGVDCQPTTEVGP